MGRRIKNTMMSIDRYRCWDTKYNRWCKPAIEFVPHERSDNIKDMYLEVVDPNGINVDIVFQKYVGFSDKNGSPAFEGDIVRFYSRKGSGQWDYKINYKEDRGHYCLKGLFHDPKKSNRPIYGALTRIPSSEIIGNIYENPELLK